MPLKAVKLLVPKSISLLLLIVFTVTTLSRETAFASPVIPEANPVEELQAQTSHLTIPKMLGTVLASHKTGSPPIILIEDAHSVPEAQKNIERIIRYVQKKYGVRVVASEGASGKLEPELLKSFPDAKRLKTMVRSYLEAGEMTGVTASAILNTVGHAPEYIGVENWALYEEGLRNYFEAANQEQSILKAITQETKMLEQKKKEIYSEELLKSDQILNDFDENKTSFMKVLRKLSQIKSPQSVGQSHDFLMLKTILKESLKTEMGNEKLKVEIKTLAEEVKKSLGSPAFTRIFNQKLQAFQTSQMSAGEFGLFLKKFSDLRRETSPHMSMSKVLEDEIKIQRQMESVGGAKLSKEFETYAKRLKENLFQSMEERNLDQESKTLKLLKKLAKLELSREEWEEVKLLEVGNISPIAVSYVTLSEAKGLGSLDSSAPPQNDMRTMDFLFHFQLSFYHNAEKREAAMLGNLNSFLDESKIDSTTRNHQPSILVAGGFHAEGLVQKLKKEKRSYILICPRVDVLPKESKYRMHMQGNVSWKKYFQVKNGHVNLYDAFMRGARDRLLVGAGLEPAPTLRLWRDQIIRDLAQAEKLDEAWQYTKILDEVLVSKKMEESHFLEQKLSKLHHFVDGLRYLHQTQLLTEPNILKLLGQSKVVAPALASALSQNSEIRSEFIVDDQDSPDRHSPAKRESKSGDEALKARVNQETVTLMMRELFFSKNLSLTPKLKRHILSTFLPDSVIEKVGEDNFSIKRDQNELTISTSEKQQFFNVKIYVGLNQDVLILNAGQITGVNGEQIPEFGNVLPSYRQYGLPFFAWWYQTKLKPFARLLMVKNVWMQSSLVQMNQTVNMFGFQTTGNQIWTIDPNKNSNHQPKSELRNNSLPVILSGAKDLSSLDSSASPQNDINMNMQNTTVNKARAELRYTENSLKAMINKGAAQSSLPIAINQTRAELRNFGNYFKARISEMAEQFKITTQQEAVKNADEKPSELSLGQANQISKEVVRELIRLQSIGLASPDITIIDHTELGFSTLGELSSYLENIPTAAAFLYFDFPVINGLTNLGQLLRGLGLEAASNPRIRAIDSVDFNAVCAFILQMSSAAQIHVFDFSNGQWQKETQIVKRAKLFLSTLSKFFLPSLHKSSDDDLKKILAQFNQTRAARISEVNSSLVNTDLSTLALFAEGNRLRSELDEVMLAIYESNQNTHAALQALRRIDFEASKLQDQAMNIINGNLEEIFQVEQYIIGLRDLIRETEYKLVHTPAQFRNALHAQYSNVNESASALFKTIFHSQTLVIPNEDQILSYSGILRKGVEIFTRGVLTRSPYINISVLVFIQQDAPWNMGLKMVVKPDDNQTGIYQHISFENLAFRLEGVDNFNSYLLTFHERSSGIYEAQISNVEPGKYSVEVLNSTVRHDPNLRRSHSELRNIESNSKANINESAAQSLHHSKGVRAETRQENDEWIAGFSEPFSERPKALSPGEDPRPNQDAWFAQTLDNGVVIAGVFDGVRAEKFSYEASHTACDAIEVYLSAHLTDSPQNINSSQATQILQDAMQEAHRAITKGATTATVALLLPRHGLQEKRFFELWVANAGDSRAYLWTSSQKIERLTVDSFQGDGKATILDLDDVRRHNGHLIQEKNVLEERQAKAHQIGDYGLRQELAWEKWEHEFLGNVLGNADESYVPVITRAVIPLNSRVLLFTDGVYRLLKRDEMEKIIVGDIINQRPGAGWSGRGSTAQTILAAIRGELKKKRFIGLDDQTAVILNMSPYPSLRDHLAQSSVSKSKSELRHTENNSRAFINPSAAQSLLPTTVNKARAKLRHNSLPVILSHSLVILNEVKDLALRVNSAKDLSSLDSSATVLADKSASPQNDINMNMQNSTVNEAMAELRNAKNSSNKIIDQQRKKSGLQPHELGAMVTRLVHVFTSWTQVVESELLRRPGLTEQVIKTELKYFLGPETGRHARHNPEFSDQLFWSRTKHDDETYFPEEDRQRLETVVDQMIPEEGTVLDLMAGARSSFSKQKREVVGLGLTQKALESNKVLTRFLVHDLNQNPKLPLEESFDAIVISFGLMYLTNPQQVLESVLKHLKPQGKLIVIWHENIWDFDLATNVWNVPQAYGFKTREALINHYFKQAGFENIKRVKDQQSGFHIATGSRPVQNESIAQFLLPTTVNSRTETRNHNENNGLNFVLKMKKFFNQHWQPVVTGVLMIGFAYCRVYGWVHEIGHLIAHHLTFEQAAGLLKLKFLPGSMYVLTHFGNLSSFGEWLGYDRSRAFILYAGEAFAFVILIPLFILLTKQLSHLNRLLGHFLAYAVLYLSTTPLLDALYGPWVQQPITDFWQAYYFFKGQHPLLLAPFLAVLPFVVYWIFNRMDIFKVSGEGGNIIKKSSAPKLTQPQSTIQGQNSNHPELRHLAVILSDPKGLLRGAKDLNSLDSSASPQNDINMNMQNMTINKKKAELRHFESSSRALINQSATQSLLPTTVNEARAELRHFESSSRALINQSATQSLRRTMDARAELRSPVAQEAAEAELYRNLDSYSTSEKAEQLAILILNSSDDFENFLSEFVQAVEEIFEKESGVIGLNGTREEANLNPEVIQLAEKLRAALKSRLSKEIKAAFVFPKEILNAKDAQTRAEELSQTGMAIVQAEEAFQNVSLDVFSGGDETQILRHHFNRALKTKKAATELQKRTRFLVSDFPDATSYDVVGSAEINPASSHQTVQWFRFDRFGDGTKIEAKDGEPVGPSLMLAMLASNVLLREDLDDLIQFDQNGVASIKNKTALSVFNLLRQMLVQAKTDQVRLEAA